VTLPVVLRDEAQIEFLEAFDHYEGVRPGLGVDFAARVQRVFDRIATNPQIHAVVFADIRKAWETSPMQDTWYADKRDLIKWGVLLRLAEIFDARRILQLAYYRPAQFEQLKIDSQVYDMPEEVIAHFRNLRTIGSIGSKVRVTVFDPVFQDRTVHQQAVLALLPAYAQERCIVFLDPDTGLESQNPSPEHVLEKEALEIWYAMKSADVLALYQHQTNRAGQPWIEPKRLQLAKAINVPEQAIKVASGKKIAQDVVFFYAQKN